MVIKVKKIIEEMLMQQGVRTSKINGISSVEMKQSEKQENIGQPLNVGKSKCVKQASCQQTEFQQVHHQSLNQKLDLELFHYGALRASDPQAPRSQPVVNKAPPSTGRPNTAGFHRGDESPEIGATAPVPLRAPVPLPSPVELPGSTSITPAYPPRPALAALPKPQEAPPAPSSAASSSLPVKALPVKAAPTSRTSASSSQSGADPWAPYNKESQQ